MKTNTLRALILPRLALAFLALAPVGIQAQSSSSTWINPGGGGWTNTVNWTNGIYADGSSQTASFNTVGLSADAIVTLDGARTIGNLIFDDLSATKHNWFLFTGAGDPLTLNNGAASPVITVNSATTTLGVAVTATSGFTKAGAGTLRLTNTVSTGSGNILVKSGTLTLDAGSGSFTIGSTDINVGDKAGDNGTLQVNSGTYTLNGGDIIALGNFGSGNYLQTGGTVNYGMTWGVCIANQNNTTVGSMTINGGTFTDNNANHEPVWLAVRGNGTLTISGSGTLNAPNGVTVARLASGGPASGSLIITNGGTLVTKAISMGSGSSGIVKFSGGTIKATGASTTFFRGLTSANVQSGSVSIDDGGFAITVGQALLADATSPGGGLTKLGAGVLTLTNANTYSGPTLISNGTLVVNGSLGTGTVSVNPATILGGSGTIGGAVLVQSGGVITNKGAGTALTVSNLTLSSGAVVNLTPSATGPAIIVTGNNALFTTGLAGSVTVNVNGSLFAGTYHVIGYAGVPQGTGFSAFQLGTTPGGAFNYNLTNNAGFVDLVVTSKADTWTGLTSSEWSTSILGGSKNWQVAGIHYDFTNGQSVFFDDSAAGTTTVNISVVDVAPGSMVFNNTNKSYTIQGSHAIAGNTGLNMLGAGTVTIVNTNSFLGDVTINAGTISVAAVADAGVNSPLGAGTNINLVGGKLSFTGGNAGFSRTFSLGGAGSVEVISPSTTLVLNGVISGSGGLVKTGPGAVMLNASNTYTTTLINGGSLQIDQGGTSGTLGSGSVTLTNSGVLIFDRSDAVTFGGAISGSGAVVQSGPGTLTLSGVNTHTGGIMLDNGTLRLGNNGAAGSGTLTLASGTLFQNANAQTITNTVAVTGSATAQTTAAGGNALHLNGPLTGAGTLQIAGGTGTQLFLSGSNSAFAGTISIGDSSDLILNSSNSGSAQASWTFAAPSGGIEIQNGGTVRLGALSDSGTAGSRLEGNQPSGQTYVVEIGGLNTNSLYAGGIYNSYDTGSSTLAITKVGTGTLTLAGFTTYTGPTTVSNGILALSGNAYLSSTPMISLGGSGILDVTALGGYTLSSGQTLQGNGTVNGTFQVSSTTVTPGAPGGAGTLTFNNDLTLNSANLNFDLAFAHTAGGGVNDLIQMNGGTLNLFGINTIAGNYLNGGLSNGTYTLIQGAGAIVGDQSNLQLLGVTSGTSRQSFGFDTTSVPGSVLLTVAGNPATLVWTGTSGNLWDLVSTPNWKNGSAPDVFYDLDNVIFNDTSANGTVDISGVRAPHGILVTNLTRNYTFMSSSGGSIDGSATLTKSGNGLLKLAVDDTSTGLTRIDQGTLQVGDGAFSGSIAGNITNNGSLVFNRADVPFVYSGVVSGPGTLTQAGTGTLSITGTNTHTGGTFINSGTLQVGQPAALSSATKVTVNVGGTLDLNGQSATVGGLAGGGIVDNFSGGPATLAVGGNNVTNVFSGTIQNTTGTNSLSMIGTGLQILSGINTYSGSTTVSNGTLEINSNGVVNCGALMVGGTNGAFLKLSGGSVTSTGDGTMILGSFSGQPGTLQMAGGSLTFQGVTDYMDVAFGNTNAPGTWNQTGGTATFNNGVVTVANWPGGASTFTISGGSFTKVTMPAATENDFVLGVRDNATFTMSGTAAVTFDALLFGHPSVPGTNTATLNLDGGTLTADQIVYNNNTAVFNFNGGTLIASATANPGFMTGLTVANVKAGGAKIDTGANAITIGQVLSHGGSNILDGGLTKLGSGVLTLTAANGYNGTTFIMNGSLLVNNVSGSGTGSGTVNVAPAGVLGGSGSLAGAVNVNGTLSPGAAGVGTLTTEGETWNNGGGYVFELSSATDSSSRDFLNISGTLNIQASSGNKFVIRLNSMADNVTPGLVPDFAQGSTYAWTVATASGGVLNFDPAKFAVDTSAFANAFTNNFSVALVGKSIVVFYGTQAPLVPPTISSYGPQSGASFPLIFSGPVGQTYRVLTTTDPGLPLATWTVLSAGTFGVNPVSFTDSHATNRTKFYSIASP